MNAQNTVEYIKRILANSVHQEMLDGDIGMNAATIHSLPDYTPILYEGRLCHTLPRKRAEVSSFQRLDTFTENEYSGKEARNHFTAMVSRKIMDLSQPELNMHVIGQATATNNKKVFKEPFYKSTRRLFKQAADPVLYDPITQRVACYNLGPDTIEELK